MSQEGVSASGGIGDSDDDRFQLQGFQKYKITKYLLITVTAID